MVQFGNALLASRFILRDFAGRGVALVYQATEAGLLPVKQLHQAFSPRLHSHSPIPADMNMLSLEQVVFALPCNCTNAQVVVGQPPSTI